MELQSFETINSGVIRPKFIYGLSALWNKNIIFFDSLHPHNHQINLIFLLKKKFKSFTTSLCSVANQKFCVLPG